MFSTVLLLLYRLSQRRSSRAPPQQEIQGIMDRPKELEETLGMPREGNVSAQCGILERTGNGTTLTAAGTCISHGRQPVVCQTGIRCEREPLKTVKMNREKLGISGQSTEISDMA